MPRFRFRRRMSRSRTPRKTSITHVPSTMDQQFATNILALVFSSVSTVVAGTSATTGRLDTDRDREVSNGEMVGRTTFTLQFEPPATAHGTIEYMIFKAERQATTPVVGTFPIPTSISVDSLGIQQAFRLNMSTWCCKFGVFPISAETPVTKNISINWAKFGKATVKDGDFYGIALFNRAIGNVDFSVQMRYKSYR